MNVRQSHLVLDFMWGQPPRLSVEQSSTTFLDVARAQKNKETMKVNIRKIVTFLEETHHEMDRDISPRPAKPRPWP